MDTELNNLNSYIEKDIKSLGINREWTLFLDRDGVINRRLIDDYVKDISEFEFLEGTKEAIKIFHGVFGRIFVVTNQRCIARKIITEEKLNEIHSYMLSSIEQAGGRIDKIYHCPHDRNEGCVCRKPNPGLAFIAKEEFREVDLSKSIMVGDTSSDIYFGKNADMVTVKLTSKIKPDRIQDFNALSLIEFANKLI